MGITYIEGVVRGPNEREGSVRFLMDSGATYTLIPMSVWEAIELVPKREAAFTLADGSVVERRGRNLPACQAVIR